MLGSSFLHVLILIQRLVIVAVCNLVPRGAFPWLSTSSAREKRPGHEVGLMNK